MYVLAAVTGILGYEKKDFIVIWGEMCLKGSKDQKWGSQDEYGKNPFYMYENFKDKEVIKMNFIIKMTLFRNYRI